jgi:hypothetical protein
MPTWFWLNVPLCALFFVALIGIPLWMVVRRPDQRPTPDPRPAPAERPASAERATIQHSARYGLQGRTEAPGVSAGQLAGVASSGGDLPDSEDAA